MTKELKQFLQLMSDETFEAFEGDCVAAKLTKKLPRNIAKAVEWEYLRRTLATQKLSAEEKRTIRQEMKSLAQ